MTRLTRPAYIIFPTLLIGLMSALPTQAQAQTRVFVAAQGADANPCTFARPCRTFQHAHDTVAANGEIDVLDPAGYGPLIITKAISIQGHGFSGISVTNGNTGITINAGFTDAVSLNGLLIEGSRAGLFGVQFNSGKSLTVENCVVRNFTFNALEFDSSATTAQVLAVSNSYFVDNDNAGIAVAALSSGPIVATIDRVALNANGFAGLNVVGANGTGPLNVAVADSVAGGTGSSGFAVVSAAAHSITNLTLTRTTSAGNNTGLRISGTNATLRLAQSTVTGNTTFGYNAINGGVILSYGDNYIDANGSNSGTLGSATKQ